MNPSENIFKKSVLATTPVISIIIPTLNAEKTIELCLKAILNLKYPKDKIELIVVDNGSTDRTLEIAKGYGVNTIVKPGINISGLRNLGVDVAKGDIYAFIDSDCIVCEDWLNNALIHLDNEGVGAAGCDYDIPDNASWIEKKWLYLRTTNTRPIKLLPGGNLIVKKIAFQKVGGFSDGLVTGEDSELCVRLRDIGYTLVLDNKIQSVHLGNAKTLSEFFKKEIWYGKGMIGTKKADKWNKAFISSFIYLLSCVVFLIGIPFAIYFRSLFLLLTPLSIIVLIPLMASLRRSILARDLRRFPFLVPIYFTYITARMISLLWILRKKVFS